MLKYKTLYSLKSFWVKINKAPVWKILWGVILVFSHFVWKELRKVKSSKCAKFSRTSGQGSFLHSSVCSADPKQVEFPLSWWQCLDLDVLPLPQETLHSVQGLHFDHSVDKSQNVALGKVSFQEPCYMKNIVQGLLVKRLYYGYAGFTLLFFTALGKHEKHLI